LLSARQCPFSEIICPLGRERKLGRSRREGIKCIESFTLLVMESYLEKIKKSAFRTAVGIFIGYLANIFKENLLTVPNGIVWLAII